MEITIYVFTLIVGGVICYLIGIITCIEQQFKKNQNKKLYVVVYGYHPIAVFDNSDMADELIATLNTSARRGVYSFNINKIGEVK